MQHPVLRYRKQENQEAAKAPPPVLNSLKVEQKGERVQVNAFIPKGLIEKMFETPIEPEPTPQPRVWPSLGFSCFRLELLARELVKFCIDLS